MRVHCRRAPSQLICPMRRHSTRCLSLYFALPFVAVRAGFVWDLEECIRNHAKRLAEEFPRWGNKCGAATHKVDVQAKLYEETLTPIMERHGYTGALWCAMYSLAMVPIVDKTQPNNREMSRVRTFLPETSCELESHPPGCNSAVPSRWLTYAPPPLS